MRAPAMVLIVATWLAACGGRTLPGGPPDGGTTPRDFGVLPNDRGVIVPLDRGWPIPDRSWPVPDRSWPGPDWSQPSLDHGGPCSSTIGTSCISSSGCCGGLACAMLPTGVAVCTKPCTPDDPATPLVNEDSCPSLALYTCVNVDAPGSTSYCLQRCQPALYKATCPAGIACDPRSNVVTRDPGSAVCYYPACTSPHDCPVRLSPDCNLANPAPQCVGLGPAVFCAPEEAGGVHRE